MINIRKRSIGAIYHSNTGITFYSNIDSYAVNVYVSNGKNRIRITTSENAEKEMDKDIQMVFDGCNKVHNILVLLETLSMITATYFNSFPVLIGIFVFSIIATNDLALIISRYYQINTSHIISHKPISKFVAAGNMAVNSYLEFNRVPTINELKKSSKFLEFYNANSNLMNILMGLTSSLANFLIPISLFFSVILWILTCIIAFLHIKKKYINILQFFIISKPTDIEIECALTGIKLIDYIDSLLVDHPKNENLSISLRTMSNVLGIDIESFDIM